MEVSETELITAELSAIDVKKETELFLETASSELGGSGLASAKRLIVVDDNIALDRQQLETATEDEFTVLNLDANRKGIKQIKDALSQEHSIETIDLISHGAEGSFTLGNTEINSDTLELYRDDLTGLAGASHLTPDVLMYGCEVGATEAGRSFVEEFSTITGLDVAASDDLTGSDLVSGDWVLEHHQGKIESIPLQIGGFDSVLNIESLLENSGFDEAIDGTNWSIGKRGQVAQIDRHVKKLAYVEEVVGQGKQMHLILPKEAKDNYGDQLAISQDLSSLQPDKVYRVQAKVKWVNPENKLPNALVSFWARNPNGTFRGQDFKIADGNDYKNLQFEFTPSGEGTTRFFLGLFTHVRGNIDDTEILVDDYKVTEVGALSGGNDSRQGNLLSDGNFNNYQTEPVSTPRTEGWRKTVSSSVSGLNQSVMTVGGNDLLRLELPKAQNYKDERRW